MKTYTEGQLVRRERLQGLGIFEMRKTTWGEKWSAKIRRGKLGEWKDYTGTDLRKQTERLQRPRRR